VAATVLVFFPTISIAIYLKTAGASAFNAFKSFCQSIAVASSRQVL